MASSCFDDEGSFSAVGHAEDPPYAGVICARCGRRFDKHAPYGGSLFDWVNGKRLFICDGFVFPGENAAQEKCLVCGQPFSEHPNAGPCRALPGVDTRGCNEYTPPPQRWE